MFSQNSLIIGRESTLLENQPQKQTNTTKTSKQNKTNKKTELFSYVEEQ